MADPGVSDRAGLWHHLRVGVNNQQRRAAKQRKAAAAKQRRAAAAPDGRTQRDHGRSSSGARNSDPRPVHDLVMAGARAGSGRPPDPLTFDRCSTALAEVQAAFDAGDPHATSGAAPDEVVETLFISVLRSMYEHHWWPVDVQHVLRRATNARIMRLLAELAGVEARAATAGERAPVEWLDQLRTLGVSLRAPASWAGHCALARWRNDEGLGLEVGYRDALVLIGVMLDLPRMLPVGPRPSEWDRATDPARFASSGPQPSTSHVDAKVLATIRALLAKAERTEFPAEAEAFTAKAQDLMARHAIDAAVIAAAMDGGDDAAVLRGQVRPRRVHLEDPYAPEKVDLLATVGGANDVRVVFDPSTAIATLVGFPLDLDLVELLFTSLLVQATRGIADASRAGGRSRSPAFRRAFLIAYAHRIGERLQEAHQRAADDAAATYGSALVPILARRADAVEERSRELFPRTKPMPAKRLDAQGWHAGRTAADLASLDPGRTRLPG